MITWSYFPRNAAITELGRETVGCFEQVADIISSEKNDHLIGPKFKDATSDKVLGHVRGPLKKLGFEVETGKSKAEKINVPVLFGLNGKPEKSFDADAFHRGERFVLEVEAGRAVVNYQFLKDLFQACVMVDVDYLGIAVRKVYKGSKDFERVHFFFDTLYTSGRLKLPLKGVLLIGY